MLQPQIHTGYKARSGGVGTVMAIVTEQPIDIHQARLSRQKRILLLAQSSMIQLKIPYSISFILQKTKSPANFLPLKFLLLLICIQGVKYQTRHGIEIHLYSMYSSLLI